MHPFKEANDMVKLGIAMMFSSLVTSIVSLITVSLITKQQGIAATGLYNAAFSLSGLFVGFVLQAMGADYYPRLTGLLNNFSQMSKLVNQQTEVGLLLATPGLVATLVFAPIGIRIFYSAEFLPAVELLQWFLFGCLGRVISWPLGFVLLALGKKKLFLVLECGFSFIHLALIYVSLSTFGLIGIAYSFFALYILYILAVKIVVSRLIEFSWSRESLNIGIFATVSLAFGLLTSKLFSNGLNLLIGSILLMIVSVVAMRKLVQLVGNNHPIVKKLISMPIIRFIL